MDLSPQFKPPIPASNNASQGQDDPTSQQVASSAWSRRGLQKWALFVGLLLLCWMCLHWNPWAGTLDAPVATSASPPKFLLDVNTAAAEEFMALPLIGPRLAQAIVDERERNGPYRALEELTRVRGVGPSTLEALRPMLYFESPKLTPELPGDSPTLNGPHR